MNATGISWWKSKSGSEDEHVEDKGDDGTHQYTHMSTTLRSRTFESYIYLGLRYSTRDTNTTRRLKEESSSDGQHSWSTATSSIVTLEYARRDYSTTHAYVQQWHTGRKHGLATQAKNKLAAAHTKMERNLLTLHTGTEKNTWVTQKKKRHVRDWTNQKTEVAVDRARQQDTR